MNLKVASSKAFAKKSFRKSPIKGKKDYNRLVSINNGEENHMDRKNKPETVVESGYDVSVTGRHMSVTDSMKEYAIEKISKLDRFSARVINASVTMDVQKLDQRVDIRLHFNNLEINSHAVTPDMYASIDKAVDRLQTQIRRYKSKIQDHHAKGVKAIDMNVNVIRPHLLDEVMEVNLEIDEETENRKVKKYTPHNVVAKETRPLKLLTLDEAIMKMELSGDAFLVYRSEEDRKLKIIYRRKDENYGVLEPEM